MQLDIFTETKRNVHLQNSLASRTSLVALKHVETFSLAVDSFPKVLFFLQP